MLSIVLLHLYYHFAVKNQRKQVDKDACFQGNPTSKQTSWQISFLCVIAAVALNIFDRSCKKPKNQAFDRFRSFVFHTRNMLGTVFALLRCKQCPADTNLPGTKHRLDVLSKDALSQELYSLYRK
jgi:hypothetical protein